VISVHILCLDDCFATTIMPQLTEITQFIFGRPLSLWGRWNDFVNPASPSWIGIDLPGSMVLGGFMILEDFLEVKHFFERCGSSEV
jgi:hypothetical protein